MKYVERLLIFVSVVLLAGIATLGVFWGGRAVSMGLFGSPVAEKTRASFVAAAPDPAPVAVAAQATDATPVKAVPVSAETAVAVSVADGEKVFKKCKACHTAEAAGANKTGPALWGIVGRPVAGVSDFGYSDALQGLSGQSWDVAALQGFLENPKTFAPGTKMAFAGLKTDADRNNVIAYLGQQADTPLDAGALGFAAGAVVAQAATDGAGPTETDAADVVEIDPVPYPEGVRYRNAPPRDPEAQAEIERLAAALAELAPTLDYERARFHPIHFPPQIAEASSEECLTCHQEILDRKPRQATLAGVGIDASLAWYQTLDTYDGAQESFHFRHLASDFATKVMKLECNFCHKGNDPREESPDMVPSRAAFSAGATPEFTLRKMVNPSETCLRCHGTFPDPAIMGLEGPWHEVRADMEWPEAPNGCLSCHAESFRTVRHGVDYLNAENIEQIAREGSSDTCYGCHGGRAWYRISYPYPRHDWPGMDEEVPDWAVNRPRQSDPEYALPAAE